MGNTESIIMDSNQMEGLRRDGEENDRDATLHGVKDAQQVAIQQVPSRSECPVPEQYRSRAVYNVYNQRIDPGSGGADGRGQGEVNQGSVYRADVLDPTNNMPIEPNQQPCPGQKRPLSIRREKSTIPKGGTDTEWLYPSPQMFFNALKRKGKGDDVSEQDMEAVVHTHNTMNELTWQEVMVWESLHRNQCKEPTLLRFTGRPDDLSPLARLRGWFGGPLPFDRHDWYVDRCGEQVRYVIDFYFDDEKAGSPEAFEIVARPAIDSFDSALDRLKMRIYRTFAHYGLPCPITGHMSEHNKTIQNPNATRTDPTKPTTSQIAST